MQLAGFYFPFFSIVFFFPIEKHGINPFFTLPVSHFCAPGLMLTKFSSGVDRLMVYNILYAVHGLTDAKGIWCLKIL